MADTANITEKRWADFEAKGEMRVRQELAERIYSEETTLLALQWLAHLESARRASEFARIEASNREHIRAARSAKNAAWTAAIAAMILAICTVIAMLSHK
jgi:hypothetical protein